MKNPLIVPKCNTSTDEVIDQDETAENGLRLAVRKRRASFIESNIVQPGETEYDQELNHLQVCGRSHQTGHSTRSITFGGAEVKQQTKSQWHAQQQKDTRGVRASMRRFTAI